MTLSLIVLALTVGIVAVSVQYLNKTEALTHREIVSLNASSQRLYWTDRIALVGPESAYREFKEAYADDPLAGHTAAHLFGDILYQEAGDKGFLVCDAALGYGCLHQVVADLLIDAGPHAIKGLAYDCEEEFGNNAKFCIHGIGHGVAEYYRANTALGLELCLRIESDSNQYSCAAGVFMEQLVPFTLRDDVMLQPVSKGLYAPCDDVLPQKFRNTCFYSLPHWWFALHKSPDQVVSYCDALSVESRHKCAGGVGVDLPGVVGYERSVIHKTCGNFRSPEDQLACLNSSKESLRSLGLE